MISTRFKRTDYTVNFLDVARLVKGKQDPISKYFSHLQGGDKSILIRNKSDSVYQCALDINLFLRRMVPLKKNVEETSFDDLFLG